MVLGLLTEEERFKGSLLQLLGEHARDRARRECPSRTLRRSMAVLVDPKLGECRVSVPHYWAVYYHRGRGPARARRRKFIVFFKRKIDDPRTDGGKNYPVRASQIRRLTKAQFRSALAANKIVVVRAVGPAKGVPFFDRGLKSFPVAADLVARAETTRFLRALGSSLSDKDTLRVGV